MLHKYIISSSALDAMGSGMEFVACTLKGSIYVQVEVSLPL